MDFGRAFTYAFEDPDWLKKVGIAALVFLIPVVGAIIVLGWALEITRRVINDDPQPLPAWDDFGGFLGKGFKAFVVNFAYVLPVLIVVMCGQAVTFGAAAALSDNADLAGTIATISSICMGCFALIFGILAGLMVPPAFGALAVTGELGAAFRFGEIFGMLRAAIGPYLMSLVIVAVAAMVLSPIGGLVCGIGALATSAYLQVLSGHLYGQAYKIAKATVAPAM